MTNVKDSLDQNSVRNRLVQTCVPTNFAMNFREALDFVESLEDCATIVRHLQPGDRIFGRVWTGYGWREDKPPSVGDVREGHIWFKKRWVPASRQARALSGVRLLAAKLLAPPAPRPRAPRPVVPVRECYPRSCWVFRLQRSGRRWLRIQRPLPKPPRTLVAPPLTEGNAVPLGAPPMQWFPQLTPVQAVAQ